MIRLLLMCLFIASSTHDIHFTKTTLDYNEETKTLQVVMNVFTDDLELAIESGHDGLDLEIGAENQHELTDSLVGAYVLDHFLYTNNMGRSLGFEFIGFEYDYDICYMYLESETHSYSRMNQFKYGVNMFIELYDDQENIVEINTPYYKDTQIFTKGHRTLWRYVD